MKNKIDQYTDTDDEKLLALIEQGDEGAFTRAYERYHKLLLEKVLMDLEKIAPVKFEYNEDKKEVIVKMK